jgi:hypothetical protein
MYLIYFDESGNSGTNLADPQQPVFVLGALVVPESSWQAVEADLERVLESHYPSPRAAGFEVHAGDLRQGTGDFKGVPVTQRLALRDEWLRVAAAHNLRFIYRAITKSRYERWMKSAFGHNISVNPHLAAFPLVAQVANNYLRGLSKDALGIIISDDNREVVDDIERFLKLLRATSGALRLDRIIEKGFFIDSKKSLLIQLADLCALHARKEEERKIGLPPKSIDDNGITLLKSLVHRGEESFPDVIQWLQQVQK